MESVIILILFTYPGAFVEFTYWYFAKDKAFYKKPEEYFRAARVFFLSAVNTMICLLLFVWFGYEGLELSNAVRFLEHGNNAIYYSVISLAVSGALGAGWYGIASMLHRTRNNWLATHGKAPSGPRKQVWMSMMADPRTPQTQYVIEIRKHGELVRCGLAYHVPEDLREDTGFALMHCDLVKEYMDNPEYDVISAPLISYIDIKTDAEIIIRDAEAFSKWLAGENIEAE